MNPHEAEKVTQAAALLDLFVGDVRLPLALDNACVRIDCRFGGVTWSFADGSHAVLRAVGAASDLPANVTPIRKAQ